MPQSNRKRYISLIIVLIISAGVSFFEYHNNNLLFSGSQLFLIEYEDRSRHEDWGRIIERENDPFVDEFFGKKEQVIKNPSWNSYKNLPAHFLYRVFRLRGSKLWLTYKIYVSCLGICTVLLIFLISDLFYGPLVGLISSILMAFSPHVYIHFNVIDPLLRGHNILFSLLIVYLFLLALKSKKWFFSVTAGIIMGINFSFFFFIGSFMIPLILFTYCVYRWRTEQGGTIFLKKFLRILLIAIISAITLDYLRSLYFNLQSSIIIDYFKGYFSSGSAASHSTYGIVLFNWKALILNIGTFIQGLFIDGKTLGGHYSISPPGIPLVYNYLTSLFFVAGCFIALRERRYDDMFFFIWFIAFAVIYSLIIVMRLKNISIWIIPPIFVLAARSIYFVSLYFRKRIRKPTEKKWVYSLSVLLIVSSMTVGSFWVSNYLPKRNFYHGVSTMGAYQIYQYISRSGYSEYTKIVFPTSATYGANMSLRLFTGEVPEIISLSTKTETFPDFIDAKPLEKADWVERELEWKKSSDKIYYCFTSYEVLPEKWYYQTDENYRNVFKTIHPAATPFIIKAPAGGILWKIYEINCNSMVT